MRGGLHVKVIRCTACGHTVYKELPRCPSCGRKSLVFQHTYETSGAIYDDIMRNHETHGSNPVTSMIVVTLLITGLSYLMFTWMFPQHIVMPVGTPKAIASSTK
jgi:uncharacterized protein (DUF983 family)